jgi:hypothetical protein
MEEVRKAFRVVVGKPRGKRPIERPKSLKNNIKMDLNETEWLWTGFICFRKRAYSVLPMTWQSVWVPTTMVMSCLQGELRDSAPQTSLENCKSNTS